MDGNNRADPLYRVIRIMAASAYIAIGPTAYCDAPRTVPLRRSLDR